MNHGREFHTRWARTWLRWFIIDVAVNLGFLSVASTLGVYAVKTWPTDQLQAVILAAGAAAIAWRILQPSTLRSTQEMWRKYTDDRDKAREAVDE